MKIGIAMLVLILTSSVAWGDEPVPSPSPDSGCSTTAEFVKTLSYLRSQKEFAIDEAKSRKIAEDVSQGCSGAAKRFTQVVEDLFNSGLASWDAVKIGTELAQRKDSEVATFLNIFDHSFGTDALDLDLRNSVKIALSLTSEYTGDTLVARKDFEALTQFCISREHLDLPKPRCALFAARITHEGQTWKTGAALPFIHAFEFIRATGTDGPGLATDQALQFAENIVVAGPGSDQNFIQAYSFGTRKDGLALGSSDAVKFAFKMVHEKTQADGERALASQKK